MSQSETKAQARPVASRRRFLKSAAMATASVSAVVAAPRVIRAQDVTVFKFQSTWSAKDIFNEYAQDYVNRVNEMAGGRLQLELLTAGTVVKAFELQQAVSDGILDGGHGVPAYWYGKHKGFSFFGTGPAFGFDANQLLGWFYYGGGRAFYDELVNDILGVNVVGFLTGPMATQPLGWFKEPVTGPEALNGLKYRTVGLSADLFTDLGAAVTVMPGGEIVPAIQTGTIDAAEFNNPSSDLLLGFVDVSKVYMLQSFHQPAECLEVIFNKDRYNALPADLQAILKYAAEAASADMSWKQQDRYSNDLAAIRAAGVDVQVTPESVLQAQLESWDTLIAQLSSDEYIARVIESQKAWAQRVVGFYAENQVSGAMAYQHFFG